MKLRDHTYGKNDFAEVFCGIVENLWAFYIIILMVQQNYFQIRIELNF